MLNEGRGNSCLEGRHPRNRKRNLRKGIGNVLPNCIGDNIPERVSMRKSFRQNLYTDSIFKAMIFKHVPSQIMHKTCMHHLSRGRNLQWLQQGKIGVVKTIRIALTQHSGFSQVI